MYFYILAFLWKAWSCFKSFTNKNIILKFSLQIFFSILKDKHTTSMFFSIFKISLIKSALCPYTSAKSMLESILPLPFENIVPTIYNSSYSMRFKISILSKNNAFFIFPINSIDTFRWKVSFTQSYRIMWIILYITEF